VVNRDLFEETGSRPSESTYPGPPGLESPADRDRVKGQGARVLALMEDGRWRTLAEIAGPCFPCSQTSASARLRDLRKQELGGWTVDRRLRFKDVLGLWEYHIAHGRENLELSPRGRVCAGALR
jgi:hypothetical protein